MPRVILDTDMGSDVDDALCLALALASPEIDLAAITTIGDGSRLRAQITRRLLDLAGRSEIPVYAGCRVPMLGGDAFGLHGHEGEGLLEPGREPEIAEEHAADAILRLTREEPDLEIVLVGPMTNLALALIKDPDLVGRVSRLTIMGGHLRKVEYGGQVFPPGIDHNLCSDPHASYVVLRSGIPTRLVTADVTLQTWLRAADLARIGAAGTPFHIALAEAVRIWTPIQNRIFGSMGARMDEDNVAFLHDPLTMACVHDESFCTFETIEVEVAIEAKDLFRTLERPEPTERSFPMRCARAVDATRFRTHCVDRVGTFLRN